ncbi:MAG: hypothetical protein PVI71_11610 [Desulfobacterales bacterium]|jgi:hypothetical protein
MKTRHTIRLVAVLALWGILMPQTLFSEEERFVHGAFRDTIFWVNANESTPQTTPEDTAIEWPGERLGLLGPIIAFGGKGSKAYIAVYDPAGVLVGAISKNEAKENPRRLGEIVRVAQKRAIIQNQYGLISMFLKALPHEAPGTDTQNQ